MQCRLIMIYRLYAIINEWFQSKQVISKFIAHCLEFLLSKKNADVFLEITLLLLISFLEKSKKAARISFRFFLAHEINQRQRCSLKNQKYTFSNDFCAESNTIMNNSIMKELLQIWDASKWARCTSTLFLHHSFPQWNEMKCCGDVKQVITICSWN